MARADRWIGVAPAVVGHAGPAQPPPPVAHGVVEAGRGLVDVRRRGQALGPGERAVDALSGLERMPGADPVPLDPERHVGLEPDRHVSARRVRRVAAPVDHRPLRRDAAVVEDGLADELDLDHALEALDGAHERVVGVVVGRRAGVGRDPVLAVPRPDRQGVADDDPAGRRLPGGDEDVRPRLVDPRRRMVDPEGAEAEDARSPVQQAAEHAGRVEAGDAEPVDGAVGSDERPRVAVGEERVVRDRREGRRRGGALRRLLGGSLFLLRGHVLSHLSVMSPTTVRASLGGRRRACPLLSVPRFPARTDAPWAAPRGAAA